MDDIWFEKAQEVDLIGVPVRVCPVEEMIWQKAYIMERERFDGGDVAHLIRARAEDMDWARLIARFGPDWRVLLSHLVLFGFIYPAERDRIPRVVMEELAKRMDSELTESPPRDHVCQGTYLSRAQYLPDVERWGYVDGRSQDRCKIHPEELQDWTNAIDRNVRSA